MAPASSLNDAFVSPDAKRRYNRRMFSTIAPRYDLFTRLFSYGRDRHWKTQLINLLEMRHGCRVLDLACGTGDLAFEAADRGASVLGLDITPRMIELAREKAAARQATVRVRPAWIVGDMTALPVTPGTFDVVTTGYGLRNVPDLPQALAEIHRALKPGGSVGSLDFDRPSQPLIRAIYLVYLDVLGGIVGWLFHRDPDTYRYISASIRRYPGSEGVAGLMRAAGFVDVRVVPVLGGLMAIHLATKSQSTK